MARAIVVDCYVCDLDKYLYGLNYEHVQQVDAGSGDCEFQSDGDASVEDSIPRGDHLSNEHCPPEQIQFHGHFNEGPGQGCQAQPNGDRVSGK